MRLFKHVTNEAGVWSINFQLCISFGLPRHMFSAEKGCNTRTKQSSNRQREFPQPTCSTSENSYTAFESPSCKTICPMILVPTSQTQPPISSTALSHQYELSWCINSKVRKALKFV